MELGKATTDFPAPSRSLWVTLCGLFRLFVPTQYELSMLEAFRASLRDDCRETFDAQIASFNAIRRFLSYDARLKYGFAELGWRRSRWKKRHLLPKLVEIVGRVKLAECAVLPEQGEEIRCELWGYDGILHELRMRSRSKQFVPRSAYKIGGAKWAHGLDRNPRDAEPTVTNESIGE